MRLSSILGVGNQDIAIDLGTANTLVFVRGRGIVLSEPSVVAMDTLSGEVHAVGDEAKRMIGRTPATISATRPLRHGVIADFEVTEEMLRYFIRRANSSRFAHPRVVMCVPSGVTEVEQRAVEEACRGAGAREVHLIEESLSAAIGAGLPIGEPSGSFVLDIGGGTSEVAVLSLGGIVESESLRVGGYELDEAIVSHVKRRHNMVIGYPTAEELKMEIGSAHPLENEMSAEIRGRDIASGLPKSVVITSEEVREALAEPVQAIVQAVRDTLERTPAELASDIAVGGLTLAGGGALLQGFENRLRDDLQMPVNLAESPLTCVVRGAGASLEEVETLARARARPVRADTRTA
ncbi:MAG: rod shape-determining protein MreB [Thermoleophilaceae bacterium]|nr:rod shape-determining protein MreB [Thermoleophilaceae bacterium]